MENEVTPIPVDKTPEQIEHEMLLTRESLTDKVAALENQVVGTVQTAADTLTGTVESVRSLLTTAPGAVGDSMKQAASAVGDKMKELLDITGHVRERPWTSVGVSAGLGFLAGWLTSGGRRPLGYSDAVAPPPYAGAPTPTTLTPPAPPAPASPGVFDELVGMIGRKVREVAETVINTASASVNQTVQENVPKLVNAAADRLTPDADVPVPGRFDRTRNGYSG